jgi:hypothetical protein
MKFLNVTFIILLLLLGACRKSTIEPVTDSVGDIINSPVINRPPSIDALIDETVPEGSSITTIDLSDNGDDFDVDGEAITYTCFFDNIPNNILDSSGHNCSTLPGTISFNPFTGVLNWTPSFTSAGNYELWFTANDGALYDLESVNLTISSSNQPPVLDTVSGSVTVAAGSALTSIDLSDAGDDFDADGESLTYTCLYETSINGSFNGPGTNCSSLPGSATFNSTSGIFNWTPGYGTAGTYEVWFSATDGNLNDTQMVEVTVSPTNRAPVLDTLIASVTVGEGSAITSINLADGGESTDDEDSNCSSSSSTFTV